MSKERNLQLIKKTIHFKEKENAKKKKKNLSANTIYIFTGRAAYS